MGYLLMLSGIGALIITNTIISSFIPSIVIQGMAFVLMLWARNTLGMRSFHLTANPSQGNLVTTGPYKLIRHPIYAAVCLFVWASVLAAPSLRTALFSTVVTVGAILRIICEERSLLESYPEYGRYSCQTKRMIPFVF